MRRHRTTARGVLLVLLSTLLATGAAAAHPAPAPKSATVPQLIFPVVGPVTFTNDYGAPRGNGRHAGIDIMAPKRALVVAAEAGKVKFWTTSWRAGCMLYLYGESGTTYLYIHLNNDRTRKNDNRGGCKPGVAYFPGLKSGDSVEAGEPIGYNGDSGDADGIASHLHFEIHRKGRGDVNPYAHLKKAKRLLFAWRPGATFKLALRGTVVEAADGSLEFDVDQLRRYPGGLRVANVDRTVQLAVSAETSVFDALGTLVGAAALAGKPALVWTEKATATLDAQLGLPGELTAERVTLSR